MTNDELESTLRRILADITADSDALTIDAGERIRDQLDLDSMDFLNFLIAVDEELHVDIPEADYPKLRTLDDIVAYLAAKSA
ncbi:MAG TPA: phosphopantetheine-binding protein [Dehalococcoidia bacterium]|nr:phosphopantetheine-binding protein [Dehalococcoidia bacterium]